MTGRVYLLVPGVEFPRVVNFDDVPTLDWLYKMMATDVPEKVPHFNSYGEPGKIHNSPCVAFCDENGLMKGLQYNEEATVRWAMALALVRGRPARSFRLYGPVAVLCGDRQFMAAL